MLKNLLINLKLITKNIIANKLLLVILVAAVIISAVYSLDNAEWAKYDLEHPFFHPERILPEYSASALQISLLWSMIAGGIATAVIFSNISYSNIMDRVVYSKNSLLSFVVSFLIDISLVTFGLFLISSLINIIIFGAINSYWIPFESFGMFGGFIGYLVIAYILFFFTFSIIMFICTLKAESLIKIVLTMIFIIIIFWLGWTFRFSWAYEKNLEELESAYNSTNIFHAALSGVLPTFFYTFVGPTTVWIKVAPSIMPSINFSDTLKIMPANHDYVFNAIIVQASLSLVSGIVYGIIMPLLTTKKLGGRYD